MYILLYSKYSRSCIKILDRVDQLNSMMDNSNPMVQLVCIDNKETRKRILNSNSIEIKKVPCLLVVDNTTIEKYDGERAFEWISEVIQKISVKSQPNLKPPSPPPKTMIQIETPPQSQNKPQKQSKPQNNTQSKPQKQNKPQSKPKTKKRAETKIEDLEDIEEDEEEDEETENRDKPKKPPIPNRNESGSYIIDGSSEEDPEEKEDNQEKKSTNQGSKGMGILDIAFAMRQEREKGK